MASWIAEKEGEKLNAVYVTDLGAFRECLPTPVRPATNEPKGVSREQKDIQEPDSGKPGVSPGPVQHLRSGVDSLTGSRRSGPTQPAQDILCLFRCIPLSFKNFMISSLGLAPSTGIHVPNFLGC